jgi:hypothetical protein
MSIHILKLEDKLFILKSRSCEKQYTCLIKLQKDIELNQCCIINNLSPTYTKYDYIVKLSNISYLFTLIC